jgi:hypothetical protein
MIIIRSNHQEVNDDTQKTTTGAGEGWRDAVSSVISNNLSGREVITKPCVHFMIVLRGR